MGQRNYGFRPEFLKLTREYYGAGLEEVDYARDFEAARKTINEWVEKQTNNKIKELLKPGILNSLTRLVLTNAIYFKASWQRPFNPKQTRLGDFRVSATQKVKVPMMRYARMRTRYHDARAFHLLELPYKNRELSMIVMAPKKVDGLAELEKKLTPAVVDGWLRRLSTHLVDVTLPKFKVTSEFMLNDVLEDLGIKLAFDRNRADFSGMATQEQLFIRAVVHKAFVDVNEKGTEAAAATAVVINARSRPPRATFVADRPFLYLIRDNRSGSILFMGRLTKPGKTP